jgi:uncharacterized protein YacL
VVNEARKAIGTTQELVVIGFTKTSAGRLVFAEIKGSSRAKTFEVPRNAG